MRGIVRRGIIAIVAAMTVGTLAVVVGQSPTVAASPNWGVSATYSYSQLSYFKDISCPSVSVCYAFADGVDSGTDVVAVTSNGGAAWTLVNGPNTALPEGISCPTVDTCYVATSAGVFETTDDAATWNTISDEVNESDTTGINCPAVGHCIVVGNGVSTTFNNGATWTTQMPDFQTYGVDCPTSSNCYVVGDGFGASTDGGNTWTFSGLITIDSSTISLLTVSCPTATVCYAGGGDFMYTTTVGGIDWSPVTEPSDAEDFTGISCPAVSTCMLAGNGNVTNAGSIPTAWLTADGGSTWYRQSVPSTNVSGNAGRVTCPSDSECFLLGSAVVTDGGVIFSLSAANPPTPTTTTTTTSTNTTTTSTPLPPSSFHGYWLVGSDGGIFSFGTAQFEGSMGGKSLQKPVVGITPTPDRLGYWLVASDGGVFAFGDTTFYGSLPGDGFHPAGTPGNEKKLNAPIVGMVPTFDDHGYFMVAADGGVFGFGDANFEGSCPGMAGGCSGSAVAVMPDATGNGYWVVTQTGHVYAFGDATNYGQPGLQGPAVTSAVRTPSGQGYWILFSNGLVKGFGNAGQLGDPLGALSATNPATAIFATSDGGGYWVATANGTVYPYGDAPNDGGMSGTKLNGSIVAAAGS